MGDCFYLIYIRAAVENAEGYFKDNNIKLLVKAETPIQTSYQPELNISPEIKSEDGAYYQYIIGILR